MCRIISNLNAKKYILWVGAEAANSDDSSDDDFLAECYTPEWSSKVIDVNGCEVNFQIDSGADTCQQYVKPGQVKPSMVTL